MYPHAPRRRIPLSPTHLSWRDAHTEEEEDKHTLVYLPILFLGTCKTPRAQAAARGVQQATQCQCALFLHALRCVAE